MKLLNKTSWYMLLGGFIAYWVYGFVGMLITLGNAAAQAQSMLDAYDRLGVNTGLTAESIRSVVVTFAVIGFLITVGLSLIFFFKALSHRKTPQRGTYLTVLLVFLIIFAVFGLFSLIVGTYLVLIDYVIYGVMIAAIYLQRSNKTPVVQPPLPVYYGQPMTPPNADPYQQNPYQPNQQNSYQQNPYRQNPYGQQPNPYQQNQQSPYGQNPYQAPVNPNPYQSQQNPYGQQPQDPFGGEYGQNGQDKPKDDQNG
ncbi:hypothetical protein FACS1894211_09410 [Clostridia bacterium]|nr:hypothetical protein FACS1894211_09410 [Clostridia bacterium]